MIASLGGEISVSSKPGRGVVKAHVSVRNQRDEEERARPRRERLDREYDAELCAAFAAPISLIRRGGEFRV